MPKIAEVRALSLNYSPIITRLSPGSRVLILAAYDYLASMWSWEGTDAIEPGKPTKAEWDEIEALVAALTWEVSTSVLTGTIFPYVTAYPPNGALVCDGASYNKVDYPELYAVLDSLYILDVDTFKVPDLRGRTVIGVGNGAGLTVRALDDKGGEEVHTLTEGEMPSHNHSYTRTEIPTLVVVPGEGTVPAIDLFPDTTGNTGGGGAHENMPPYIALNYGIWAI